MEAYYYKYSVCPSPRERVSTKLPRLAGGAFVCAMGVLWYDCVRSDFEKGWALRRSPKNLRPVWDPGASFSAWCDVLHLWRKSQFEQCLKESQRISKKLKKSHRFLGVAVRRETRHNKNFQRPNEHQKHRKSSQSCVVAWGSVAGDLGLSAEALTNWVFGDDSASSSCSWHDEKWALTSYTLLILSSCRSFVPQSSVLLQRTMTGRAWNDIIQGNISVEEA